MKRLGVDTIIGTLARPKGFVPLLIDGPSHQRRRWLEQRLCRGGSCGLERRETQASFLHRRLIVISISTLLVLRVFIRYVGQTRMTLEFVFRLCRMPMISI